MQTRFMRLAPAAIFALGLFIGGLGLGTGTMPIAPDRPSCAKVRAVMDTYPADSIQFRHLSMVSCSGSY